MVLLLPRINDVRAGKAAAAAADAALCAPTPYQMLPTRWSTSKQASSPANTYYYLLCYVLNGIEKDEPSTYL